MLPQIGLSGGLVLALYGARRPHQPVTVQFRGFELGFDEAKGW